MPLPRARVLLACALLALAAVSSDAQVLTRMATTLAAIQQYPAFFHDKAVALVGAPGPVAPGVIGLPIREGRTFAVAPRSGEAPQRDVELRGRLFDIGRFASDDSRLGPLNLPAIITAVSGDRWPARETLLVLTDATWSDPPSATDSSLRALALSPSAFDGRTVTMRGRFRGRNLFGDLPAWPRESQWDFVLQAADAAVWVLGRRPRGDGFDLSTTNRAQTGRWLEVTGRVEMREALPVIIATALRATDAEDDAIASDAPVAAPLPPPDVRFSVPLNGETQVATDIVVRVQFSRPMRAASVADQVRVRYLNRPGVEPPPFTVTYRPAPMAVEIRFEYPLAAGTEVEVELGTGLTAADGVAFGGATLRFTTAGLVVAAPLQSPRAPAESPRPAR